VSGADERAQDALAMAWLDAEQPGGLGQREREPRHFAELRLNAREQIVFRAIFETSGVHALLRGSVHGVDS
jgi:hypothetical protein